MLKLILLFICIAMIAMIVLAPRAQYIGGVAPRSQHIVVDTLNLTHWYHHAVSPELIVATIDQTASQLIARHSGKVMYVLKDRESQFTTEAARTLYEHAAVRNKVYICMAERYVDPPAGNAISTEHSSLGRDDFYMSVLAYRHRCAVITADRLEDFTMFRSTIQPFHVVEYSFWRNLPHREYIRPEAAAFARVKKPWTISPSKYFAPALKTIDDSRPR